ncbi:hypothetical protein [Streptomyces sp. NPDC001980]|uniref:vWA-MoxR associated conflict system protein n=1 Tax=Streptomyces sp. NPDC001980 TaxID=3157126 RepID=UPI0033324D3D
MTGPEHAAGRWEKWKKTEPARLSSYVNPEAVARRFGSLGPTHAQRSADLRHAVRQVYDHVVGQKLPYETATIDSTGFHEAEQVIRPPAAMMTEGGNCLELSLLFAGMCIRHKLRPLVVLLDDHALAAVWLGGDLDAAWPHGRPAPGDHLIMSQGVANQKLSVVDLRGNLLRLVEQGTYLLVECTGFAHSGDFGAGAGQLTFEQAVAAGADRVARGNLTNVVDIAFHHRHGLYRPYAAPEPSFLPDTAAAEAVPESETETTQDPQLSPIGSRALAAALRSAAETLPQLNALLDRSRWSRPDLGRLLDSLGAAPPGPERDHLLCLAQGLDHAVDVGSFITAWMPRAATAVGLRRALLACVSGLGGVTPQGLSEHLDTVVLRRPVTDVDGRASLLGFVLRLATEAGIDTDNPEFDAWCQQSGYDIGEANALRQKAMAQARARHRRLLIHLRGDPARDWPEEGRAWLLDEMTDDTTGRTTEKATAEHPSLRCAPSADGVAALLDEVLDWVHDLPDITLLHRVDIAMPARTLLCWRAEEADVGSRLGAHHDVVLHWGDRMHPPQHLRGLARAARYRLYHIDVQDQVSGCLDWVAADMVDNQSAFEENLRKDVYPGALGLRSAPIGQEDLFEALLAQFPILLWPERAVSAWVPIEETVREQWVNLPGGFTTAYKTAWSCPEDEVPPLARLRAVWDDHHWLTFCRTIGRHRAGIALADSAGLGGQP